MNEKNEYKQKIEPQLELVKAEIEVLKVKAKNTTSNMKISYDKEIETLEKNYTLMQLKLHKLSEFGEDAWEHLKKDLEHTWNLVSSYAKKTPDKISEIKKVIK
jgi:hypothetical protein